MPVKLLASVLDLGHNLFGQFRTQFHDEQLLSETFSPQRKMFELQAKKQTKKCGKLQFE